MKSKSQIAAEKVLEYIYEHETEPIDGDMQKGRRIYYVGSHEQPSCSIRALANVMGIIDKVFTEPK